MPPTYSQSRPRDVSVLELEALESQLPHGHQFDPVDDFPPDDPTPALEPDIEYPIDDASEFADLSDLGGPDATEDLAVDLATAPPEVEAAIQSAIARAVEEAVAEVQSRAEYELERQRVLTQQAVARYRQALLAADPDLPPDLVTGDSIEAIDATAQAARATVQQIRSTAPAPRFPTGAPARGTAPDRSRLTAHQKIATGLQERML